MELELLVGEVIREIEPDTDTREIEWRIGELPIVNGDASLLRMVLSNLMAKVLRGKDGRP